jgi:hypothetical protein
MWSGAVVAAEWGRSGPVGRFLPRAPWRVFHVVVLVASAVLLWAYSYPGVSLLLLAVAVGVWGLAVLAWLVWVAMFGIGRRRWSWWFVPAPLVGVLVVTLVVVDVPLRARWAMSRAAFEAVVATLPPAGQAGQEWVSVAVPARIGGYRITSAVVAPDAVIFWEATGSGLDDAGFAYLPDGPKPTLENGSFEAPSFKHLDGVWYSWTASW